MTERRAYFFKYVDETKEEDLKQDYRRRPGIARDMRKRNISLDVIAEVTGLEIEAIRLG